MSRRWWIRQKIDGGPRDLIMLSVWADDAESCAAALTSRFPGHEVIRLAVTPRGAL